jgi:hypothetical protein
MKFNPLSGVPAGNADTDKVEVFGLDTELAFGGGERGVERGGTALADEAAAGAESAGAEDLRERMKREGICSAEAR